MKSACRAGDSLELLGDGLVEAARELAASAGTRGIKGCSTITPARKSENALFLKILPTTVA